MTPRSLRRFLTLGIGGLVFAWCVRYLVTAFEWASIGSILRRAELSWIVLACLILCVQYAVRTLRWMVMLRTVDDRVRFLDLYFLNIITLSFATMTPGQSGEALKVELLKKHGGLDRLPGYGVFFVERLADLLVVVAMAALGLLLIPGLVANRAVLLGVLAAMFAAMLIGLALLWRLRLDGSLGAWLARFREATGDARTLAGVLGLTVVSWLLVALCWQATLRSVAVEILFGRASALVAIVTIGNLLSFIPSGLGIAEVLTSGLLERMGHPAAAAQAAAVVLRGMQLFVILNGAVHLALWRFVRPDVAAEPEPQLRSESQPPPTGRDAIMSRPPSS